jgi:GNAT superfamily N-acetyltransferase
MDSMLGHAGRDGNVFRVIRADDQVAGYVYLQLVPAAKSAFIWYLALAPEFRDRGIGEAAVKGTIELLRRNHPELRYALFEIHRARDDDDPATRTTDRRRAGFFGRLGAYRISGVDYQIPAADDASRSLAYDPMFFELRGDMDIAEIRDAVISMAADNFEAAPHDPRWAALRETAKAATVVEPEPEPVEPGRSVRP